MRLTGSDHVFKGICVLFIVLFALLCLLPLLLVVGVSLSDETEVLRNGYSI